MVWKYPLLNWSEDNLRYGWYFPGKLLSGLLKKDLIQKDTENYIELVDSQFKIDTFFYNQITMMIHQTSTVKATPDPAASWSALYMDALNRGLITQTQYDNGLTQLHNLGY